MLYILGSIGAGKTSLTNLLAKDLESSAYYEDISGNNMIGSMLEKFYGSGTDSRKRTGAMLQIAFLTFRYSQLKKAITQENAILDSSLESDFIMAKQLHDHGEIDDVDYNIYVTLSQEMQSNVNGMPWNGFPDLSIYLKIDPEKEIEEIQSRGRGMEDIRKDPKLVDYYHRVNKAYREWAKGYTRGLMLTIDRDKYDFVNSEEDRNTVLNKIESKLVELGKLSPERFEEIKANRKEGKVKLG